MTFCAEYEKMKEAVYASFGKGIFPEEVEDVEMLGRLKYKAYKKAFMGADEMANLVFCENAPDDRFLKLYMRRHYAHCMHIAVPNYDVREDNGKIPWCEFWRYGTDWDTYIFHLGNRLQKCNGNGRRCAIKIHEIVGIVVLSDKENVAREFADDADRTTGRISNFESNIELVKRNAF